VPVRALIPKGGPQLARVRTILFAVATLCAAHVSEAQTAAERDTARRLMDRGDEQLADGDPNAALMSYEAAHAIMHVPTTGLEVARTYASLGKLVEASDVALQVVHLPDREAESKPFVLARQAAAALARSLAEQIPKISVEVQPPAANTSGVLEVDGQRVPRAALGLPYSLNPGEHVLTFSAPGYAALELPIALARGEHRSILLTLRPTARRSTALALPSHDARLAWPVWLGVGVASAGVAVGSVAGLISLERAGEARAQCVGDSCPARAKPDRDAALVAASVSNVGWAFAGAGAVLSLTSFWLMAHGRKSKPVASLALSTTQGGGMLRWCGEVW
jgi:hypothetical protein